MDAGYSVLLFLILVCLHGLSHVQCRTEADLLNLVAPKTSNEVQEKAVRSLIVRVVGAQHAQLFDVEVSKMVAERSYEVRIVEIYI